MVRILFAGLPEMGPVCLNALCEAKKNIVGMIMPPKDNVMVYNTMLQLAENWGIEVLTYEKSMKEPAFLEKVKSKKADLAIVASFNQKIPKELLSCTKLGFVNSHPSMLPLYRGGNPYFYPIFYGDKKTAITLHFMDEGFDTGDIIFQKEVNLLPHETMGTLFNRTNHLFAQAHVELINFLETGRELPRYPQDKQKDYPTADILHEHLGHTRIQWNSESDVIERFVRACNPFLGALTYYKNNPIKIYTGTYDVNKKISAKAGTIVEISKNNFGISTAKGVFYPTTMQLGSYFSADAKMFIDFVAPKIGETFD